MVPDSNAAKTTKPARSQSGPPDFEAVIVGGGITGLVAAIGLAQAGIRTAIFGVPVEIREDGRAAALFDANLAFLDRLGLAQALVPQGADLNEIRLIDVSGARLPSPDLAFKAHEIGQARFGMSVANAHILASLLEAAEKTPFLDIRREMVTGLAFAPAAASLTLADGGIVRTRLVVGADGQNSRMRDAAHITTTSKAYPQVALTCRLAHPRPHDGISREFHTSEGPFTLVPAGNGESSLVWVVKPAHATRLLALPRPDLEAAMTRQSAFALGKLTILGPIGQAKLRRQLAREMVRDRLALVGEAAHALPPIGAQGLNLGLKDVAALIDRVSRAHARGEDIGGACLTDYAKARARDVEIRALAVDLLNSSLIAGSLAGDLARAVGLTILQKAGPLRRLMMRLGGWSLPYQWGN